MNEKAPPPSYQPASHPSTPAHQQQQLQAEQQAQPQAPVQSPGQSPAQPQQQQGAWDPRDQPTHQQPLGVYAPQPGMVALPPGAIMVQQYPTANFCPATGGAHVPVSRPGAMGIIIGIVFCPCGLIAIPFDKKVTCDQCKYVIEESWGGC